MKHQDKSMDTIIAYAKRKGFVFPSSEIYDGLAGVYDFGPYGTALLQALKNAFRQKVVKERLDYYEIDSGIFKNPKVWVASGHVGGFSDPLADCKDCQSRIRVDKELEKVGISADEKMSEERLNELFNENRDRITCPNCGSQNFSPARAFNLLVKSNLGNFTADGGEDVYLPGEACQGIYLNYKNVVDTIHPKIPFGIAQIGKAFRNEISPRQFLFRTREFEQADTQYFVRPGTNKQYFEQIKQDRYDWYVWLGIKPENLSWKQHENLVFYASDAWDIMYNFPTYGPDEVEGVHDRTDYDLTQHTKHSGVDLSYNDNGEKFIPYILETSMGMGRLFLAILSDAYDEEILADGDTRVVLRLTPMIAPVQVAILPLMKKDGLAEGALLIWKDLARKYRVDYDESGSVGKRYRRQDEIGTPFCVTYDYDSKIDGMVTVRDRDTMVQERVSIEELTSYLREKLAHI